MGYMDNPNLAEVNLHNFAKYILHEDKRDEKRTLVSCLKQTIYIKNKAPNSTLLPLSLSLDL
jgi:hypothetical protein